MNNRQVLEKYYEYANAGKWTDWCDLFAENQEWTSSLPATSPG